MSKHFTIAQLARLHEENIRGEMPPDVREDEYLITIPLKLYSLMNKELARLEKQNRVLKGILPRN